MEIEVERLSKDALFERFAVRRAGILHISRVSMTTRAVVPDDAPVKFFGVTPEAEVVYIMDVAVNQLHPSSIDIETFLRVGRSFRPSQPAELDIDPGCIASVDCGFAIHDGVLPRIGLDGDRLGLCTVQGAGEIPAVCPAAQVDRVSWANGSVAHRLIHRQGIVDAAFCHGATYHSGPR